MTDPMDAEREGKPTDPGGRRLARAPSERYGAASGDGRAPSLDRASGPDRGAEDSPRAASAPMAPRAAPARGIAFGAIAGLVGATLIVVFGGGLAVSAGLLVIASGVGYAVGLATLIGAAETLSSRTRSWSAGALAGLSVLLGQFGLWLYARAEGGVLTPIDYLGQTFGVLVPVELLLAAAVAWWRAR